jgi:hypothetical protein
VPRATGTRPRRPGNRRGAQSEEVQVSATNAAPAAPMIDGMPWENRRRRRSLDEPTGAIAQASLADVTGVALEPGLAHARPSSPASIATLGWGATRAPHAGRRRGDRPRSPPIRINAAPPRAAWVVEAAASIRRAIGSIPQKRHCRGRCRDDDPGMPCSRPYLVWLIVPASGRDPKLVPRFVIAESTERAAEACAQRFVGHRVLRVREL